MSVHLSEGLAEKGLKTLLLDVDPQESASWWSEQEPEHKVLLSDTLQLTDPRGLGKLQSVLHESHDVAVIDTAPTLYGQSLRHVIESCHLALVPSAADTILELSRTIDTAREITLQRKPYLVVFNKVDSRALVELIMVRRHLSQLDIKMASTYLRLLKAYKVAANEQTIAWKCSHGSGIEAGKDIRTLVGEIHEVLRGIMRRSKNARR